MVEKSYSNFTVKKLKKKLKKSDTFLVTNNNKKNNKFLNKKTKNF